MSTKRAMLATLTYEINESMLRMNEDRAVMLQGLERLAIRCSADDVALGIIQKTLEALLREVK